MPTNQNRPTAPLTHPSVQRVIDSMRNSVDMLEIGDEPVEDIFISAPLPEPSYQLVNQTPQLANVNTSWSIQENSDLLLEPIGSLPSYQSIYNNIGSPFGRGYTAKKSKTKSDAIKENDLENQKQQIIYKPQSEIINNFEFIQEEVSIDDENYQYTQLKDGLYIVYKKPEITIGRQTKKISVFSNECTIDMFKKSIKLAYQEIKRIVAGTKIINGENYLDIQHSHSGLEMEVSFVGKTGGLVKNDLYGNKYYVNPSIRPYGLYTKKTIDNYGDPVSFEKHLKIEWVRFKNENILRAIYDYWGAISRDISLQITQLNRASEVRQRKPDTKSKKYMRKKQGIYIGHNVPFSCEIECYGKNQKVVSQASHDLDNSIGMCHDGSLRSNIGFPIEIQTPILLGSRGEIAIAELCTYLVDKGFMIDKTCGLHIHLDGAKFGLRNEETINGKIKPSELIALYLFYRVFDRVIISFLPSTRRSNQYCAAMHEYIDHNGRDIVPVDIEEAIISCENIRTLRDFEMFWYRANGRYENVERAKSDRYTASRYYGANFHSLLKDNHFEVRYHSGTLNYEKIMYWIDLHGKIIEECAKSNIPFKKLKVIHSMNHSLEDLTKVMFSLINIKKDTVEYLLDRQSKFKDVKASEEILIDKTKKLSVA